MRPLDPRVFQALPEARRTMAGLGLVGVLQGLVALWQAIAVSGLLVAVVRSLGVPDARPDLGRALALAVGAMLTRALLAGIAEHSSAMAGVRISRLVRTRLLRRWLRVSAEDRPDPDAARTLATEGASAIEPYVARYLPALVGASVLPVLVILTIARIDWVSALIVVCTVPLLPVFAALIGQATQAQTERRWRALTALSGHFLDVVRGLPTLVTYGRAQRQAESISQVSQRHRAATVRTLRTAFLSSAALELLATISVAIVAVTIGLRLVNGDLDLADGLTVILLAPEAYWPIRRVGTEYHAAADGVAALDEAMHHLMRGPVSAIQRAPAVSATALTYVYPKTDRTVLEDLDLQLPAHGLVVVTGPSGVGKSTLLDLLAGLRRPTAGSLLAPEAHVVSQRPLLVTATLRDNLTLGVDVTPSDAALRAALAEVGLGPDLSRIPDGLETMLGDDGFGLSAGQRARVAIARAGLSDAPLLLFDEPTAHLDAAAAAAIHALLQRLARTRCVVVVTHRPELATLADQSVVLANAAAEDGR